MSLVWFRSSVKAECSENIMEYTKTDRDDRRFIVRHCERATLHEIYSGPRITDRGAGRPEPTVSMADH